MRLGGPILEPVADPDAWVAALRERRYRAAYLPVANINNESDAAAYAEAARRADIVIAEVPAWSNPLSTDIEVRRKAVALCQERLALADRTGARCCVNISGSLGPHAAGPDPRDLTDEAFALIVETVRAIIDAVKPARTCYTLETAPWMYPDSTESYLRLLKAIDRERFAVHFDPVNLICSPQRYWNSAALVREFVATLGPHIRSCHLKDIRMAEKFMVHLDEAPPGEGGFDHGALLGELSGLDPDLPVMMEHLPGDAEYRKAATYYRSVAAQAGVGL